MKPRLSADTWLALFFFAFALLLIFVWVPLDTDTGLIEKIRRSVVIGDALGPTVSGVVIALGAGLVILRPTQGIDLSPGNLVWIASLLGLFTVSLALMRYAGPVATLWSESGYRPLRATPPWNYIGFVAGGTAMVGGLTSLATLRLSGWHFAVGFAASLAIALLYDVPFDDLILPPNGDV